MTEQRKTQQQLSQEQLHAITGGCKLCDADLAKAATHQATAAAFSQRSQELFMANQFTAATLARSAAATALDKAKPYLNKVNARHSASSSTATTSAAK